MEAAITAARCGHSVTLIEKSENLGGLFNYAAIPPEKTDVSSFTVWQETQLNKLGVKILTNTEANEELIDTLAPDAVILASGSSPVIPPIPGVDKPNVYSAIQVLEGEELSGKSGVVIGGGLVGMETAHHLICHGKEVCAVVEMLPNVIPDAPYAPRNRIISSLKMAKTNIMVNTCVEEILDDGIIISTAKGKPEKITTDFVVIATGFRANNPLAAQLDGKTYSVYCVGDAIKARTVFEAVHEGYEIALSL